MVDKNERTREELEAENAAYRQEIDNLRIQATLAENIQSAQREQLDIVEKELEKLRASGAGWLIETENPLYDGKPWGVPFANGQAFLKVDLEYPQFTVEKLTGSHLERYLTMYSTNKEMQDRERIALAARESVSSAEVGAMRFKNLLGYRVEFFSPSAESSAHLQSRIATRFQRAQATQAEERARRQMEMFSQPQRLGV